ncbi:MAG: hypothetical protein ABI874_09540, partial [Chloroflexota bacterium]
LKAYVHKMMADERAELGAQGIDQILERGRQWKLSQTLQDGGSIIIPHAGLKICGHQIAACAQACLDSGAQRVLAVGVLHALTDELQDARMRVANGADVTKEKYWGMQGPGLGGYDDWASEYSMLDFLFLVEAEAKRRGMKPPEVIVRYPYLAGGRPMILPGIAELQQIVKDGAVVISTADAFHHGIGYGEPPESALYPEQGGLVLARKTIGEGLAILQMGDYWGYNQHCVSAKSDARDAGQVVRYLLGPLEGRILDITYADMTAMYASPAPTWVTAALIEQKKVHR